ncbi:MAG TPA: DUF4340 domain-containing protein [Acidimicrobiia bacterium]
MKRLVTLVLVVGVVALGWRLSGDRPAAGPKARPVADVLTVAASAVAQVALESRDGHRTVLRQPTGGVWVPDGEAAGQAANLMTEYQDGLFPLRAYRQVSADPKDPQYGLADPDIRMHVEDSRGQRYEVAVGQTTFTGAGRYAQRADEAGVLYLVPNGTVDQLRSLLAGEPVASPRTPREADLQQEFQKEAQSYQARKPGDPLPPLEENAWLAQALEADGSVAP